MSLLRNTLLIVAGCISCVICTKGQTQSIPRDAQSQNTADERIPDELVFFHKLRPGLAFGIESLSLVRWESRDCGSARPRRQCSCKRRGPSFSFQLWPHGFF